MPIIVVKQTFLVVFDFFYDVFEKEEIYRDSCFSKFMLGGVILILATLQFHHL